MSQFDLDDEQRRVQEMARSFAGDAITPAAAGWAGKPIFPRDTIRLLLAVLLLAFATCAAAAPAKRVALTFDDAPLADGPLFTGKERAERLIAALKAARVKRAAFFVITGRLASPEGEARIRAYAAAGHLIANHSDTHRWLRRIGAAAYLADTDAARRKLAGFANTRPWFRYPFLDEGPDAAARDAVRDGLKQRGLSNGYVTVDTWDWALVDLVRKAGAEGRKPDMNALRDLYLEMMLSAVDTYDGLAREALGRSPAHVLLAHENDLSALFVDDLVAALRKRGWTIISPEEAYRDPIARDVPDTLRNGNGRVAALAAVRGIGEDRLGNPFHDEALLKQLFERRVLGRQPSDHR
jgi:peptidoglycan-N-acetylglucosamine deacetylase